MQSALTASQAEADAQKKVVKDALEEAEAAEAAQEKAEAASIAARDAAAESKRQQVRRRSLSASCAMGR